MSERFKVLLFLTLMKTAAAEQFVLASRKKNLDTLAMLGIGLAEAKERVMGLLPEDYVSGPDADKKRPGDEVWVFGLRVDDREIYVKVCVITEPLLCTCISFHFAERALSYPLRSVDE